MKHKAETVSAIILAGGLSSRMGSNKAELEWDGVRLIEHQVNKLRALGIDDIIISGYPQPVEGARFVADKYLLKGPLGGIHAGLLAAENSHCLVISVDVPLVPVEALSAMIDYHIRSANNITVLAHDDSIEPLIGIYERWLSKIAETILQTDRTSVRELFKKVGYSTVTYTGDPKLIKGCNTPQEYLQIRQHI